MADIRNEKTEQAIADALLDVLERKRLADISVTELARQAHVSRSTFYLHFPNVRAVFVRAVRGFWLQTRDLNTHLRCASCGEAGQGMPFCVQLRTQERYHALVREPDFLPCYLEFSLTKPHDPISTELREAGLPSEIVDAVRQFQLSGCYAVATGVQAQVDWPNVQDALDAFIRGGLGALRSQAPRQLS